jgi:hypothetical protein
MHYTRDDKTTPPVQDQRPITHPQHEICNGDIDDVVIARYDRCGHRRAVADRKPE